MSINLEKHRDSIIEAWRDVLNSSTQTNWALYGYDGPSNDLKFVSKGDGGLEELLDDLNSGKIMYAFLKVDVPESTVAKYVLINWQGEGAPTVRKGTCANHIKVVAQLLSGFHVTMHARTEDDLEMRLILKKLAAAGSTFNVRRGEGQGVAPSGPVGTAYQKVNPGKEINCAERDQFWQREEQEERRRRAEENKRKDIERRRGDEERRATNESGPEAAPAGVSASEALRRQRSAEARQLIGESTSAARAVFTGQQATHRTQIPEKPIRSSVIAQRINSLTQQSQQTKPAPKPEPVKLQPRTETQPESITQPLSVPTQPESVKTQLESVMKEPIRLEPQQPKPIQISPIRNIDKIAMSLESPSQIQHEHIFTPSDLSPNGDSDNSMTEIIDKNNTQPMIKQNILENDQDASYSSSSNENDDDDDSDNKFSTIKRSPYSKNNVCDEKELYRQDTVIENVNYKNGNTTLEDISPEGMEDDGIYQDLDEDPGLTARALYDYQAADETEISFDPGDVITHIDQIDEGWWQGLGPHGTFGLFPANYVELMPAKVH